MRRALLLDLDGTLLDSAPDIGGALDRYMDRRGRPGFAILDVWRMIGDGIAVTLQRAHAAHGLPAPTEADAADFLADYEAHATAATRPFEGIPEALDRLAAEGWVPAVCTNKPEHAARLVLERWNLLERMAAVAGGDSYPVRKPHPDHLLLTLARMGLSAGTAVMVGDHANDVRSARAAGIAPVFAAWGYGLPEMADGAPVAASPAALFDVIGALECPV